MTRPLDLGWYCPSEGDGRFLGHATRPSGRPRSRYLARVARAAERAGAARDPDPDGDGQRLVRPRRAVHGELDHGVGARRAHRAASASWSRSTRRRCAPELAAHQAETLERDRARADRDQPGRRRRARRPATAPRRSTTPAATPASARWPTRCARASPGPLYLGGASEAAVALAARVGRHLPDVGRAARARSRRGRADAGRRRRPAHARSGLRIHVIARATDREARAAAARAAVARRGRRRPGRGVRGVRQRRPGADERDRRPTTRAGWRPGCGPASARCAAARAPRWWAPTRGWRGCSATYRDAGVDLVIASGYPHLEEVGRRGRAASGRAWPGAAAPRDPAAVDPRPPAPAPPSWPSASARRSTSFDGARMEAEARAFRRPPGPDVTVAYSMKSNPLMGLVARLHRAGCWAEVASGFEYRVARRAGVPGSRDRLQRPAQDRRPSCGRALREGATVIADGAEQVREIARLAGARRARRAGRPAPGAAGPRGRATASACPRASPPAAASLLAPRRAAAHRPAHPPRRLPARPAAARGPADPRRDGAVPGARGALRRGRRAAARGGRARRRHRVARPGRRVAGARPALGAYLDAVREALGPGAPPLVLEPGRALIRDAGWLLTRVVARRGPGAVVVDAGITQVPCVLWKRSPVHAGRAARRAPSGRPTCSGRSACSTTRIAREVPLPPLRVGDLVWIGQTGAYAMAQASPVHPPAPGRRAGRGRPRRPAARRARPTTRPSARRPSPCWRAPRAGRCRRRDRGPRPRRPLGRQREDDGRRPRRRGDRRRRAGLLLHGHARQPRGGGRPGPARTPPSTAPGPTTWSSPSRATAPTPASRRPRPCSTAPRPAAGGGGRRRRAPRSLARGRGRRRGHLGARRVRGARGPQGARRRMDVLLFSDGVAIEDEVALKRRAHELGLLVMGPGAGTAISTALALGFANVVAPRPVGVVAAAGTGAQEVTVLLDRRAPGCSRCYGTGGRDLKDDGGRDHGPRRHRPAGRRRRHRRDPLRLQAPRRPDVAERVLRALAGVRDAGGRVHGGRRRGRRWTACTWRDTLEEAALAAARLAGADAQAPAATRGRWVPAARCAACSRAARSAARRRRSWPSASATVHTNAPAGRARRLEGRPERPRLPGPGRGGVHPRPAPPDDRPDGARRAPGRGGAPTPTWACCCSTSCWATRATPTRRGCWCPADPRGPRRPPAARRGGLRPRHRGRPPGAQPPGGRARGRRRPPGADQRRRRAARRRAAGEPPR